MFEFLQSISDFFTSGIYSFVEEAAKYLIETAIIWWIKTQIWGLTFAWEIAQGVLTSLNVSQHIAAGMSSLSSEVVAAINFFRVPEAINILLTAGVTRMVMSLIPGL